MTIELPENVKKILKVLMDNGHEAYAVGGCVRDSLLYRIPEDWDITTSASPLEVKQLFRRTIDTGLVHGTVTIMFGTQGYEVTTYRIDGEYEDGRHPKEVVFTKSLEEDLKRRDFTINAMAYNEEDGLVDLFGGQDDLKNHIIRAVGNPYERFNEDALRILRAVRFAGQLNFSIHEQTAKAAADLSENLKKISAERIRTELVKLMLSDHPDFIRVAYELGITKVVLPEFDALMITTQNTPHHMYTVGEHTIKAFCNIDDKESDYFKYQRLALLFHDISKPECKTTDENGRDHFKGHPEAGAKKTREILKRLKFDNKTMDIVVNLVRFHDLRPRLTLTGIRRAINMTGLEIFEMLFPIWNADVSAQSEYERQEKLDRIQKVHELYMDIVDANDPLFIKDLNINGTDLIREEVAVGRQIGQVLAYLLDIVLDDPRKNDYEVLLENAKSYIAGNIPDGMYRE